MLSVAEMKFQLIELARMFARSAEPVATHVGDGQLETCDLRIKIPGSRLRLIGTRLRQTCGTLGLEQSSQPQDVVWMMIGIGRQAREMIATS